MPEMQRVISKALMNNDDRLILQCLHKNKTLHGCSVHKIIPAHVEISCMLEAVQMYPNPGYNSSSTSILDGR